MAAAPGHPVVAAQFQYYEALARQCGAPDGVGCGPHGVPFWLRYGPGPLTDILCGTTLAEHGEVPAASCP